MSNIDTLIPPGLVDFLDLGAVARIVDVGCGNGSFTSYLAGKARSGSIAIGLDTNLAVLRDDWSATDVERIQAVAERIPIRSDSADLVICRRLLMNLPTPLQAVQEMTRVARPGGLVAALEPDFLAERGFSTVPREMEFLQKLLLLSSEGSDLGFGPKTVALFREAGLRDIDAFVHSPVAMTVGGNLPTVHRERAGRRLTELVEGWHEDIESRLGPDECQSLTEEAEYLDSLRDEQLATGDYCSASSFPLWIVRGRKPEWHEPRPPRCKPTPLPSSPIAGREGSRSRDRHEEALRRSPPHPE